MKAKSEILKQKDLVWRIIIVFRLRSQIVKQQDFPIKLSEEEITQQGLDMFKKHIEENQEMHPAAFYCRIYKVKLFQIKTEVTFLTINRYEIERYEKNFNYSLNANKVT